MNKPRGSGRIFLRGSTFWAAFFVNGKEVRESCKTDDPKVAERYLRRRLKETHAHEIDPIAVPFFTTMDRKRTVRSLMEALETNYRLRNKLSMQNASNIKRVTEDFGDVPALSLTAEAIARYTRDRVAETKPDGSRRWQNASINRTLECLRAGYALAEMPAPKIVKLSEANNTRHGFFAEKQIREVIANLPPDVGDFVLFGWLTGWRKSAISHLRWTDLDGDTIVLRAEHAKNRTSQRLPLAGELKTLIERRRQRRAFKVGETAKLSDWIFHRRGQRVQEFRKTWRTATTLANCAGFLFHDMRRSMAKHATAAGVPQHVVMATAGWKSPNVFRRYAICDEQTMRQALERTQDFRRAEAEKETGLTATVQ